MRCLLYFSALLGSVSCQPYAPRGDDGRRRVDSGRQAIDVGRDGGNSQRRDVSDGGSVQGSEAGQPRETGTDAGDTGARPCQGEADCPIDQYCRRRTARCTELPDGTCRQNSHCEVRCVIPEGSTIGRCIDCQTNADCDGDHVCFEGRCAPPTPPCTELNCPAPRRCVEDRCVEADGNDTCQEHADCAETEQCLDLTGQRSCVSKCNTGIWATLCQLPNQPMCVCTMAELTCNQQTGYCE
jgi:hypothetical protein